ncbi:MAG: enoyl-CoA hydratase/isomerase family protein [Pseudomonadales bacterium]
MQTLEITDENGIRIIRLDRPKALNAFSQQLMDELAEAFIDARELDTVRVVVLTGNGRAFSAGADLTEMGQPAEEPKYGFPGLLDAILTFPKPFLLAINGLGAGIGATICGLADFSFIAEDARLRCPFSALGLTAEAGSTYLFPQLMGRQRANWFLLSAQWMSAQECVDAGLVMEMCPTEELLPTVMDRTQTLAALPLSSLTTTKTLIMDPLREQLRKSVEAENAALAALVGTPANREALAAFREKREANLAIF